MGMLFAKNETSQFVPQLLHFFKVLGIAEPLCEFKKVFIFLLPVSRFHRLSSVEVRLRQNVAEFMNARCSANCNSGFLEPLSSSSASNGKIRLEPCRVCRAQVHHDQRIQHVGKFPV